MYSNLEQRCDLCKKIISVGEKYGVLVFNVETLNRTAKNKGVITVQSSKNVNTMCLECASKYDGETIKSLLD